MACKWYSAKIAERQAAMETLTLGVELETVRVSPSDLAAFVVRSMNEALAAAGETARWSQGASFDRYHRAVPTAKMPDGREWKMTLDGSLRSDNRQSCEVVSPILTVQDIPLVQEIARTIKRAGATVNDSCGMHVHVGAQSFNRKSYRALLNNAARIEPMMLKAFNVSTRRISSWCQRVNPNLVDRVRRSSNSGSETQMLQRAGAYDQGRYFGLNLMPTARSYQARTIEFRYFDGTLHAGRIRTAMTVVAAFCASALTQKTVRVRTRRGDAVPVNRTEMLYWLNRHGLGADETIRKFMLEQFPRTSARGRQGFGRVTLRG